jgi:hypothetical protein
MSVVYEQADASSQTYGNIPGDLWHALMFSTPTNLIKSGSSCNETIPPAGLCVASRLDSSGSFIIRTALTPTLAAAFRPSAVSARNIASQGGSDAA